MNLFEECFDTARWERVIDRSVKKDMNYHVLRDIIRPDNRLKLAEGIANGTYTPLPPHIARVPKDGGGYREVCINEDMDRVLLAVINDALSDMFPDMIHSACKSYQKKLSCGKAVRELVGNLKKYKRGVKSDFHHYFDTVSKDAIFHVFNKLEDKMGVPRKSDPIINLLRRVWSDNHLIDYEGNFVEKWMGIRQGNAVGSFLANVILYELDEFMSKKYPYYVRYSDDTVVLCRNPQQAVQDMTRIIKKYGVSMNPKKVQFISGNEWFSFLGFLVKDDKITLNRKWTRKFMFEIKSRTIYKHKTTNLERATKDVMKFLYHGCYGDRRYSWAASVLPYINVKEDVDILNGYVMDCLRAVHTKRRTLGGLGVSLVEEKHGILRGKGRDVSRNSAKLPHLDNYLCLQQMKKILSTNATLYEMMVNEALAA